jgi:DNA repair protein RadA/Sms
LIAVMSRHGGIPLGDSEVYAATVGGIAAHEPSADLAILLALSSAARSQPIPATVCAIGEVSLSGDVRRVGGLGRRLAEAARLGFTTALVPGAHSTDAAPESGHGMRTVAVATLADAMRAAAALADTAAAERRATRAPVAAGA